ncbi:hypothetical protein cypCar_00048064 [Cyprinus carpio]|nr:hypothetical protein cypCar_00048064 [Cyprinus carpio]
MMNRVSVIVILFLCSITSWGKKMRWCTVSEPEQRKCAELAKALVAVLPPAAVTAFGRLSCVKAYGTADCINKIRDNKADLVTLDAGEVYSAVKQFGLTVVAKEIYRDGGCILAVAVMLFGLRGRERQRFQLFESASYSGSDLLFKDVTEKLSVLMEDMDVSQVLGLDYVALLKGLGHEGSSLEDSVVRWCCISHAEQKKCEQWALSIKSDPLCTVRCFGKVVCQEDKANLCKGVWVGLRKLPPKRCADTHNERYYGNMGALRCLVGDPSGKSFGDVAFMEHHNLESNIERLNTSGWAEGWLAWDFELLCGDGSRAPLTEWKTCNLGAIPPNIVMTRPVLTARIYDLLMKSQETIAARPDSGFHLFESLQYGESDLLFKDATRCLVHTSHMDYRTILGEEFYSQAESIFNCTHSNILQFCNQDVCSIF